jgi:uncharacterized protein (TIGR03663 family)
MSKTAFRGLFLLIVFGAILYRVAGLDRRPMHNDEANQAVKFGRLLEKGEYAYDKNDHHGPSLYYLTLPLAKARGQTTFATLDEITLRLVPAIFGVGMLLLFFLFLKDIGRRTVLFAGALAAVSPALVYYSRFYIQETIFVFFVIAWLGSLWRYIQTPTPGWAAAWGFFAGMMFATKETSVIIFVATAAALVLTRYVQRRTNAETAPRPPVSPVNIILGILIAAATAALFFSSFFTHPKGVLDSILAFSNYFTKGGDPGFHAHPPWYYFGLLSYFKSGGLVWSEALILALASLGVLAAFLRRKTFIFFLSAFTFITAAIFSLIPYKTPWNVLPFYTGAVLLAGVGADFALRSARKIWLKAFILALLGAGVMHLAWQSWQGSFPYSADPRNPYVYAQTSPDFLRLVRRVQAIADVSPERERMLIKVVAGPYETWPLPWYLRRFERVGYWTDGREIDGFEGAGLVIASQDQAERVGPQPETAYQSEFYGLRPDVLLTLYIRRDLWDKLRK